MSVEWNCHGIMAFWWYRKCQGRDKTFIFKALDNHLWIVSFHQVFISNRPIIDMDVIIFLDGFDILGNGLVHSVQSLNGYSFTGHQNKPVIVYFLRSEFLLSVIFSSKFQVQQHIFCSSQYQVQHPSISPEWPEGFSLPEMRRFKKAETLNLWSP